jgi:hypothetical protein
VRAATGKRARVGGEAMGAVATPGGLDLSRVLDRPARDAPGDRIATMQDLVAHAVARDEPARAGQRRE